MWHFTVDASETLTQGSDSSDCTLKVLTRRCDSYLFCFVCCMCVWPPLPYVHNAVFCLQEKVSLCRQVLCHNDVTLVVASDHQSKNQEFGGILSHVRADFSYDIQSNLQNECSGRQMHQGQRRIVGFSWPQLGWELIVYLILWWRAWLAERDKLRSMVRPWSNLVEITSGVDSVLSKR